MQQYEEDKDEKSYQGKYFIIEMLIIQRLDAQIYSLLNNLDLKCNTRCIFNVNTFLAKEDPC